MRIALRQNAYVCLECRLHQSQRASQRYQSDLAQSRSPVKPVDLSTSLSIRPPRPPPSLSTRIRVPKVQTASKTSRQNEGFAIDSSSGGVTTGVKSQSQLQKEDDKDGGGSRKDDIDSLKLVDLLQERIDANLAINKSQSPPVVGVSFEAAVKTGEDGGDLGLVQRRASKKVITAPIEVQKNTTNGRPHPRQHRRKPEKSSQAFRFVSSIQHPSAHVLRRRMRANSAAATRKKARIAARLRPRQSNFQAEISTPTKADLKELKRVIPSLDASKVKTLSDLDVKTEPLLLETPQVPSLSFNLSRVLFNPGVYQLQDPRSRVFNFSPYLQRILPVSEFNFDVLNEYLTSSRDPELQALGLKHGKKYLGSSSSMSGALIHFHFLLSNWRPLTVKTLSQSFTDPLRTFTKYQRGPSAIFLRWKDGIYAVDADKKYDSSNVLMDLGRSMEKLLTLEKPEFERYRKGENEADTEPPRPSPEAYHYTEAGDFLLRSQLDAYDSRLPGTGMFDLKTRAVVSIRMNVGRPEDGMGYEIQNRFGDQESYEKEYFDMIRSAFLKYSLQVRMGRMDGIFVAYHNIERIFGFQYVSLPEMDAHLHGTENPFVGDGEFKFSLGLLNRIFDHVTAKMPNTSIRIHFEARDSVSAEGIFMYIFAEAQAEKEIEMIQKSKSTELAALVGNVEQVRQATTDSVSQIIDEKIVELKDVDDAIEQYAGDKQDGIHNVTQPLSSMEQSSPAEPKDQPASEYADFTQPESDRLIGLVLRIRNRVNGKYVIRPGKLDHHPSWEVEYTLDELPHGRALATYNQCRTRRQRLHKDWQEETKFDYFLEKMKRLARKGRNVRQHIDRSDAGRPVVVFDGE